MNMEIRGQAAGARRGQCLEEDYALGPGSDVSRQVEATRTLSPSRADEHCGGADEPVASDRGYMG